MDYIKWLKIDNWWKAVFWLGVALLAITLVFDIQIVNAKHLMGLSIGLIMIGLSVFGAQRYSVIPAPELNGMFEGYITKHNWFTCCVLIIGFVLSLLFLTLIIDNII